MVILSFLIILFADATLNLLTSGPYGLIFSSFIPFYFDIPISTRFRVFGIRFTDKSFIYLAGLQVIEPLGDYHLFTLFMTCLKILWFSSTLKHPTLSYLH